MVTVTGILPRSRAMRAGIREGDVLVSINGREIRDVLDYRFYLANRELTLSLLRDGQPFSVSIRKQEYDDIGLEFETPLMDKKHSCENKCVFCFIDQLPKGMRKTLYFKDDDSRLSFLHGNYVTMTNMQQRDIERIVEMHISPVNISVHTTNPELRVRMMHNKRAGEVLSYLRTLADGGISLCCQIVLCKGLNDGSELDRTLHDLMALHPAVESVAVVPAGLTCHRDGLYPLEAFTKEDCRAVIRQINTYGDWCKKTFGTRLIYPSDEFYVKAELPLPDEDYYEEYSQIQNGVGLLTDMRTSFCAELAAKEEYLPDFRPPRHVSVATGEAAYQHICELCRMAEEVFDGLQVSVYLIQNDFFGHTVTVAGLLTGQDLCKQLAGKPLGSALLIPSTALRSEGDLLLDDRSPEEISAELGVPVHPTDSDGAAFLCALLGIE
ncbi:MAG: DUF512 domain-containing protein [Clostridia bacterium]|nr:DUF512 domain-containing protein [Clostridia bacterium]